MKKENDDETRKMGQPVDILFAASKFSKNVKNTKTSSSLLAGMINYTFYYSKNCALSCCICRKTCVRKYTSTRKRSFMLINSKLN